MSLPLTRIQTFDCFLVLTRLAIALSMAAVKIIKKAQINSLPLTLANLYFSLLSLWCSFCIICLQNYHLNNFSTEMCSGIGNSGKMKPWCFRALVGRKITSSYFAKFCAFLILIKNRVVCVPAVALIVKVPQFAAKSRAPRQLHFSIKHGVKQTLHINKYSKSTPPSAYHTLVLCTEESAVLRTAHTNKHTAAESAVAATVFSAGAKYIRAASSMRPTQTNQGGEELTCDFLV